MTSAERVAVVGTGLIGTSIAMAALRAGDSVRGFDVDTEVLSRSAERSGLVPTATLQECVTGATLVLVCTPIPSVPQLVGEVLRLAPEAVVTDVASVKSNVKLEVQAAAAPADLVRYVGGHPMGGSERSGPDHASASVLDGAVWVVDETAAPEAIERLAAWIAKIGARAVSAANPQRTDLDLDWRKAVVAAYVGYALREIRGDDMRATRMKTARQAL